MGRENSQAIEFAGLVYEVSEGTAGSHGEQRRQGQGHVFEGRFKSIAILDEEASLTTLAYVDLNPVAVGIVKTPEESEHTSVKARLDHCRDQETLDMVIDQPTDRTKHDRPLEDESFWLVPIEDWLAVIEERDDGGGEGRPAVAVGAGSGDPRTAEGVLHTCSLDSIVTIRAKCA